MSGAGLPGTSKTARRVSPPQMFIDTAGWVSSLTTPPHEPSRLTPTSPNRLPSPGSASAPPGTLQWEPK